MAAITGRAYEKLREIFNSDVRVGNVALDPILLTQHADHWSYYLNDSARIVLADGESAAGTPSVNPDSVATGTSWREVPDGHLRVILAFEGWHNDAANRRLHIQLSFYSLSWVSIVTRETLAASNDRVHLPVPFVMPGPDQVAPGNFVDIRVAVNAIGAGAKVFVQAYGVDVPLGAITP